MDVVDGRTKTLGQQHLRSSEIYTFNVSSRVVMGLGSGRFHCMCCACSFSMSMSCINFDSFFLQTTDSWTTCLRVLDERYTKYIKSIAYFLLSLLRLFYFHHFSSAAVASNRNLFRDTNTCLRSHALIVYKLIFLLCFACQTIFIRSDRRQAMSHHRVAAIDRRRWIKRKRAKIERRRMSEWENITAVDNDRVWPTAEHKR